MTAGGETPPLKRLNEARMRPGDIILVTSTSKLSGAIRIATRSDISHAMVWVEDRSVIDATGEGVQARNTQRLFLEAASPVHVLRLRGGLSPAQLATVRTYLRGHIGARYSKRQAAMTVLGGARQWDRKQFCSRLVAQAFASAGIGLVRDPNFCSPADLHASPRLDAIADPTLPVTPEEAAWWEGREDVPQLMRDAINGVLKGARLRSKHIETFDDIHQHLIVHPEQDEEMCELLHSSGYLTVWQIERDKNPWQYDLALMNAAGFEETADYCWSTLASEDGEPNRYVVNRGGYTLLARQHGLRFFQVMADLFELLATLHRQRVATATRWLESHGLLDPAAVAPLVPHSDQWFEALSGWNPAQAMMTKAVLEIAGHSDVCSICGDDPVLDYRLEAMHRPAGGVDTLRLCDDCLSIRRAGGEPYATLDADVGAPSSTGKAP